MAQPLGDGLGTQASLLASALTAYLEPKMEAAGISLAVFELLSAVRGSGRRASQADVARRLGVTPPSLSEAVRSAVERGLLDQQPHPRDRRAKTLNLTPLGEATLRAVVNGTREAERRLAKEIDPEQMAVAVSVLRRAVEVLEAATSGSQESGANESL